MKLFIFLALVAFTSASYLRVSPGWRESQSRDMSQHKPVNRKLPVTTNSIKKIVNKMVQKTQPDIHPTIKSTAGDCGKMGPASIFSPKIVGGSEAAPHQFPWQVGIFMDGKNFCGGSIISDEYIMTAAHCVVGFSSFEVIIGAHELKNSTEEGQMMTTTTTSFVHPGWDEYSLANDIAFLQVDKIKFNDYVSPICLPSSSEIGDSFEGEIMTISGWGLESDQSTEIAQFLNWVAVPIISNSECDAIYGVIEDGVICISTEGGKGTCNGDSGGPLVMKSSSSDAYSQYGIVSFGAEAGCEAGFPAGFTRVTEYLAYIFLVTGIVA